MFVATLHYQGFAAACNNLIIGIGKHIKLRSAHPPCGRQACWKQEQSINHG